MFTFYNIIYVLLREEKIIIWKLQIDVVAIHEEMVTAIEIMDEIEDIVIKFLPRVIPLLFSLIFISFIYIYE